MGIATRDGGPSRFYWLASVPLALLGAGAAWWWLKRPEPLLALGWIPVGLLLAYRNPRRPDTPTPDTQAKNQPVAEQPDDVRLQKEYWDRKLQAARQRRSDRRPTPSTFPVTTDTGESPGPSRSPHPTTAKAPPTLSKAQRQALARQLAPRVHKMVRQRAPHLPPDKVKLIVIREVQKIIQRKLQTGQIATNSRPAPSKPTPPPRKPAALPDIHTPTTSSITDAASPPVALNPMREHARQQAVAQILDAARKSSRQNRLRRQVEPQGETPAKDRPLSVPRARVSYRTMTECLARCNSSLERTLLEALVDEARLKPQKTELKGEVSLQIQVKVFKYNVDFLVNNHLAVEVVEFSYNNDKMSQIRDRVRGSTLSQAGFLGMRVTAEEINADARAAARRIIDIAQKLATPIADQPTQRDTKPLAPPETR